MSDSLDKLKSDLIPSEDISFEQVKKSCSVFSNYIKKNQKKIIETLQKYETYEVSRDEISRTLDLLDSIEENKEYFHKRVGRVVVFLPLNQPLYALSCFAIIPSLMASEVFARAPMAMRSVIFNLWEELKINTFFPNISLSTQDRTEFVKQHSSYFFNKETQENTPLTEVVIFTGNPDNASSLRKIFDNSTLFISNGSGHNPIVVTDKANIKKAIAGSISVQLYNQGQDCAGPNSILVHKKIYDKFVKALKKKLRSVRTGPYSDKRNTVGPITERKNIQKIIKVLNENSPWIDAESGKIDIKEKIVYPTLILKPLCEGGNYEETFAPIFFIQTYEKDEDLTMYFDDPRYEEFAMYITVFGQSDYIDGLIGKNFSSGRILHDSSTIIIDKVLHSPGVERGTQPYGGFGTGASSISINGLTIYKPTLPQRDIFEACVKKIFIKKEDDLEPEDKTPHDLREIDSKHIIQGKRNWTYSVLQQVKASLDKKIPEINVSLTPHQKIGLEELRAITVASTIGTALNKEAVKAKLTLFWNDYESLSNTTQDLNQSHIKHVGKPLLSIPDDKGKYISHTKSIEEKFKNDIRPMGLTFSELNQGNLYNKGFYLDFIKLALEKRDQIANIIWTTFKEDIPFPDFVKNYYPIKIYSRFTGKDSTEITDYDGKDLIKYKCICSGNEETISISDPAIKLDSELEQIANWIIRGTAMEVKIKNNDSKIAQLIATNVFDIQPPVILECGKIDFHFPRDYPKTEMEIEEILKIYEPEVLMWLFSTKNPHHVITLHLDGGIFKTYDEFDRSNESVCINAIPFRQAVTFGQSTRWNIDKIIELSRETGQTFNINSVISRIVRSKNWLEKFNPEKVTELRKQINSEYINQLTDKDIKKIIKLRKFIEQRDILQPRDLETFLYSLVKDNKQNETPDNPWQKEFFKHIYNLLVGKDYGPKLPTFIWAQDRDCVLELLNIQN